MKPHKAAARLIRIVLYVIGGVLLARFLARLAGLDDTYVLPRLLYDATDPMVAPFAGMLPENWGGVTVEVGTLVAIPVYAIAVALLTRIVLSMGKAIGDSSLIDSDAREE